MSNSTKKLIDDIKRIRKEKGISQAKLAGMCNMPQSTIGRIENYSMNPSIDIIIEILNALEVKIKLQK